MTVNIVFNNLTSRRFPEVESIKYEPGFVIIQETYYRSISIPSGTISEIVKESRRSF